MWGWMSSSSINKSLLYLILINSLGWILPWPRGLSWTLLAEKFFIVLSAGIHLGEFFLGQEVFYRALDRDSLGWILPWPRGLFWTLLAEKFFIGLSAGIHLGEFFLSREVYLELSWPRSFLLCSRQGFTWVNSSLTERLTFELSWPRGILLHSRQGFTWVNSSLAERCLCINDFPENFDW